MKKNMVLLLALAFSLLAPAWASADTLSVPCLYNADKGCNPVTPTNPLPINSFAAAPSASITRSANTTTYTANTAWNNGTPTFFSFMGACGSKGGSVLIPQISITSSANPTLKLAGNLWLFSGVPANTIADDANFVIAAASGNPPTGDFSLLTGGTKNGISFTLAAAQGSGASNSGVSLDGTTYQAMCPAGSTTLTGSVEVTNAYVPASGEVLTVTLSTIGLN